MLLISQMKNYVMAEADMDKAMSPLQPACTALYSDHTGQKVFTLLTGM